MSTQVFLRVEPEHDQVQADAPAPPYRAHAPYRHPIREGTPVSVVKTANLNDRQRSVHRRGNQARLRQSRYAHVEPNIMAAAAGGSKAHPADAFAVTMSDITPSERELSASVSNVHEIWFNTAGEPPAAAGGGGGAATNLNAIPRPTFGQRVHGFATVLETYDAGEAGICKAKVFINHSL